MGKVFDIAIFYLLHERPRPHHDSIVRFLGAEILEGACDVERTWEWTGPWWDSSRKSSNHRCLWWVGWRSRKHTKKSWRDTKIPPSRGAQTMSSGAWSTMVLLLLMTQSPLVVSPSQAPSVNTSQVLRFAAMTLVGGAVRTLSLKKRSAPTSLAPKVSLWHPTDAKLLITFKDSCATPPWAKVSSHWKLPLSFSASLQDIKPLSRIASMVALSSCNRDSVWPLVTNLCPKSLALSGARSRTTKVFTLFSLTNHKTVGKNQRTELRKKLSLPRHPQI